MPDVGYKGGHRYHSFRCAGRGCKQRICRYLDKNDAKSTSNLRKHAKSCWGTEAVEIAGTVKTAAEARECCEALATKWINHSCVRTNKERIRHLFTSPTHENRVQVCPSCCCICLSETDDNRAEIVRWVCENTRPFSIVSDPGFHTLMKTGRPEYYIPSPSTVSRDVRLVFLRTQNRIGKMLNVSERVTGIGGHLSAE